MPTRSAFVLILSLAACSPLATGGAAGTGATGIHGAFSAQRIVANEGHDVMLGQVFVLRQDDRAALTAELVQTRHSGRGRLRLLSAWMNGKELPFRRALRTEPHCDASGRCTGWRAGTFVFTPEAFAAAARDGFEATVIGPDGVVTVHYPLELFAEARANARRVGLWP